MQIAERIERYLWESLGLEIFFKKHSDTKKLPIYLKQRFELMEAELFGTCVIIAIKKTKLSLTPFNIKKTVELLKEKLQKPVIYCEDELSALEINRLIKYGVQFIVPGKQLHLPQLLISLTNTAVTRKLKKEYFTPVAQCTVIYMLKSDNSEFTISAVAEDLGYTNMSISRAFGELENFGIIKGRKMGRTKFISFSEPKEQIVSNVVEFLVHPNTSKKIVRVMKDELYDLIPAAGMTALSEYSMINDDKIKTYACMQKTFKNLVQKQFVQEVPFKEEADINLELWTYNPVICEKFSSKTVDPLSLFASLKDDSDERVAKALEEMMENVTW